VTRVPRSASSALVDTAEAEGAVQPVVPMFQLYLINGVEAFFGY